MLPSWSWRANPSFIPAFPRANRVDKTAADELELYMYNDSRLYPQHQSIVANIQRRLKNGTYNQALAPKLWQYWVDAGAKAYVKEFGSSGARVDSMFDAPTRRYLAKEIADEEIKKIRGGEYFDVGSGRAGAGVGRR
jgi:hypothetical protein